MDEPIPNKNSANNNNYMSERIEKTLQKYSKKEILKNSALSGKPTN